MKALELRSEEQIGSWPYRLYQTITDFHNHKWMYDKRSLILIFTQAGFYEVEAKEFLDSRISSLEEVEKESRVLNGAGICVEGIKA